MPSKFSFTKAERLKSEKIISGLFKEGHSYVAYPLRVVWQPVQTNELVPQSPVQFAVSVPKRAFKTAVARNRIKRQIREAWRLHKHLFYAKLAPSGQNIALMVMYFPKEALPYKDIEGGVKKMVNKFSLPAQP